MNNEELLRVAAAVQKELKDIGVRSVLIGALAPTIQIVGDMAQIVAGEIHATKDVDTVISVDSWEEFNKIKQRLKEKGFTDASQDVEHKMVYRGVEVDLIPFGPGVIKDNRLTWPDSEQIMNMIGTADAIKYAQTVLSPEGQEVLVAPLWATVVLKLFAYEDRRTIKKQDIDDAIVILRAYAVDEGRRHIAPIGYTFETSGAYHCGCDIRASADRRTTKATIDLLEKHLKEGKYSNIVSDAMQNSGDIYREETYQIILALLAGLKSGNRVE